MGESPSALRRDVDEARDELGETVEELAYRVAAPKRLAARLKAEASSPAGAAVAVGVATALVLVVIWRRA
jgi:tetrahydromethanopterin S-methyltransferase subunit F